MAFALTIGNFDGIHRGHEKLISEVQNFLRTLAHAGGSSTDAGGSSTPSGAVVSFEPHPSFVLTREPVPRLCTPDEKVALIAKHGLQTHVIPFTPALSTLSAGEFLEQHIAPLSPRFIVVGTNFYFGKNRIGSPDFIRDWCNKKNILCVIVPPVMADDEPISSSRIRSLLGQGKVNAASRLLGRDFSIRNEVIHGEKRGRQLGFPTANMKPQMAGDVEKVLPKNGVYFTAVHFEGQVYPGITNVGVKPTIRSQGELLIETHLLNFDGDLYGKHLTVEFRDRLRDEMKFRSLEELRQQIQQDRDHAQQKLSLG